MISILLNSAVSDLITINKILQNKMKESYLKLVLSELAQRICSFKNLFRLEMLDGSFSMALELDDELWCDHWRIKPVISH